jgi:hypothetical protein
MRRLLGCIVGTLLLASPGSALVLCQKKSGAVFVRAACKKKGEKVIDPVALGLQGPKGDAGATGQPGAPGIGPLGTCPPDSALVGTTCVDTYEASVWQIPLPNAALLAKVQAGTVTLGDLTTAGAVELSVGPGCAPGFPLNFPGTGNWTPVFGSSPPSPGVYAVSIAGVLPSGCVTAFQAAQACALSGKRLIRNDEWQQAAAGTPDPGTDNLTTDCAVSSPASVRTGSRTNCQSVWGVFDMVGNVSEWVAGWVDSADNCTNWSALFGNDLVCFGGPGSIHSNLPGGLFRGGSTASGTDAGVFAGTATVFPSASAPGIGFRCAR